MSGPLTGVRVLEMAGIGPAPFAGMMLADMGADVVRLDRPGSSPYLTPIDRGRRSIAVDVKSERGRDVALELITRADILLEGFRPGVMERLGLGPSDAFARNAALVYGRMTGYGQSGPLANSAGHDINYIALGGALDLLGTADGPPLPPLNLVGDFGGGGMLLAFGAVSALHHARATGEGQVVDAAMIDGVGLLMAMWHGLLADGSVGPRGTNGLDGVAPYYRAYETADGGWMAVGAIEPQFYQALVHGLELDASTLPDRNDRSQWPQLTALFADTFRTRTREAWSKIFEQVDGCVSPVLDLADIDDHPHHVARDSLTTVDGVRQPAPAPRMSVTAGAVPRPPAHPGEHSREVLAAWGFGPAEVDELCESDVVAEQATR